MSETNVERLAHIQYQIDDARLHGGMYSSPHVELEWLIEQAEQVDELNGSIELYALSLSLKSKLLDDSEHENKHLNEELEKCRAIDKEKTAVLYHSYDEITRLRKALEFYGDKKNYHETSIGLMFRESKIYLDKGIQARKALETGETI